MAFNQANEQSETTEGYENPYISPRTKYFYLNTDSADIYFICDGNNDERIPAHKVVLSVASDAFNAMFHGGLREQGDVRIVDASADGFKEFLKFFYFDKVKISVEHIEEVVYLCTKYVYSSSIKICERFLLDSLNIANVCYSFGLAITYDLTKLEEECEIITAKNTLAVFQTDDFLECDKAVLAAILKLDLLSCAEIDVFDWCMAWVKAASNEEKVTKQLIDDHLGDLFRDIRFSLMTNKQLAGVLAEYSDLFAVEGHQDIVQLIASKDSALLEGEPRYLPWTNMGDIIQWPVDLNLYGWRKVQEHESTTFSTKTHILLGEISLKEILIMEKMSAELLILKKSTFVDDGNSQIVLQQQVELVHNMRQSVRITLRRPLLLSPKFEYEIRLNNTSTPPDSRFFVTDFPYERLKSKILMSEAIDYNMIKFQRLPEASLFQSLNLRMLSSKEYRLHV